MKTYVCLRVSTSDQDTENQLHGIKEYAESKGINIDEIVSGTASGRIPWKDREIGKVLQKAVAGDRILVAEYTRLARSTIQVLEIIAEAAEKKVELHITKSGLVVDGSMQSKIVSTVMALASEIERDFIAARTRESLAARAAKGLPMGRPRGEQAELRLDSIAGDIDKWHQMGLGKRQISRLANVSAGSLYLWIRRRRPEWIRQAGGNEAEEEA